MDGIFLEKGNASESKFSGPTSPPVSTGMVFRARARVEVPVPLPVAHTPGPTQD